MTNQAVTPSVVRSLANFAGLPLVEGREAAITPILDAWLRDANALSAKMSDPAFQKLVPATVFMHSDTNEAEA